MIQYNNKKLCFLGHIFASNIYSGDVNIIVKTKYMPLTFSGYDYTFFTSKTKQVACYNKVHFNGDS